MFNIILFACAVTNASIIKVKLLEIQVINYWLPIVYWTQRSKIFVYDYFLHSQNLLHGNPNTDLKSLLLGYYFATVNICNENIKIKTTTGILQVHTDSAAVSNRSIKNQKVIQSYVAFKTIAWVWNKNVHNM